MTIYYVSQAGNDGNDGLTTATPWKTAAKVSATTAQPGDSFLFNRGDTWNESLRPAGNGGPSGQATIGAYGSGALPILDGGGSLQAGIWFPNAGLRGYWTIRDIKVQNFTIAGIDIEPSVGRVINIVIDGVTITGITGGNIVVSGGGLPNAGFNSTMPTGISVYHANGLTIRNTTVTFCDQPWQTLASDRVLIEDCTFTDANRAGGEIKCMYGAPPLNVGTNIGFERSYNFVLRRSRFQRLGTLGFWAGNAGLVMIGVTGWLIDDCDFLDMPRVVGNDADGIDFESGDRNGVVRNCRFSGNQGPPFNVLQSATSAGEITNFGIVIEGCTASNNGANAPTLIAAFIRSIQDTGNAIRFRNNTVSKLSGQELFWDSTVPQTMYGVSGLPTHSPTWDYDSSNTQ